MANDFVGVMDSLIVHQVGNKNNDEGVFFSKNTVDFGEFEGHFLTLIKNSFNLEELYRFHFEPSLDLNPVYQFAKAMFEDEAKFVEQSQNCARILYDKSTHPKTKPGELQVAFFRDSYINGKSVDALALFKSENKETFLKIQATEDGLDLESEQGISMNKLDKGCLIFNIEEENGYLVAIVDNTNKGSDAQYWKDEFLGVEPVRNEYHQTKEFLGITKNFVMQHLQEEFELSKTDKIDFLNRSVDYFKKHDNFDLDDFGVEVFHDPNVIKSFKEFDTSFRQENNLESFENFEISPQAVKKQARVFKSVLKLDKNFHIYIHGNRELIEQGVDEMGRKFYKIFYTNET
jgi:hypothetical protein